MENKEALAVVPRNTDAAGLMARPTTQPSIRCMHRQLAVVHPDCCFPVAEKMDWVFQNVPDMIGGDLTGQRLKAGAALKCFFIRISRKMDSVQDKKKKKKKKKKKSKICFEKKKMSVEDVLTERE
ncbi:hypothetical protein F2P81_000398 [Scophthalmus maximus]|uniref:Uncharacterized protein n=1 Tax=Scophthalmus maximus TaxID=52904 RepID=A0A6A4TNA6_SCOMX|nr:hypothetical protein F2P81_000398 [Scophthalmus maximus]